VEIAIAVLVGLGGFFVGVIGGYFSRSLIAGRRYEAAKTSAAVVLEEAREQERRLLLGAKEEALKVRSTAQTEVKDQRAEFKRQELRLATREENVDRRESNLNRRADNLDRREQSLGEKEKDVDDVRADLEQERRKSDERLEQVANLSMSDATTELMARAEQEIEHDLAVLFRDMEERAKGEANETAINIIAQATQRLASDVVSDVTLTTVPIPTDDMKGRLIGREGRNIRAIEKATGVDLIIDDTPEAVTLSCFDPIRREVARQALGKLIKDGRIHPARIEETVSRIQRDLDDEIRKTGEQTVLDVGVRGVNAELAALLGRLKYRFSYGENVLMHSVEVAHIAAMIAGEIGADVRVAKLGGLLHDIGKALTHEVEGPHAEIGADLAVKNNVKPRVCAAIREHHDDEHSSPESFIVAAADAISAARPGARRDTVEHYVKRLEALEEVGRSFDGVEKCFAIQAGREVRIMVKPQDVDDVKAQKMARDVVKKIEETLAYPGQIQVTVIRESRAVDYAR